MGENLRQAFNRYTALASRVLKAPRGDWCFEGTSVKLDEEAELRLRIDFLEKGSEFKELVKQTNVAFAESPDHFSGLSCESAVGNFFRRSSYYLDVFDGRAPDAETSEAAFRSYCAAFERRQGNLCYLAPLEFVSFAEARMDFEGFGLRQFTRDELDQLLGNRINRMFFPLAVIDPGKLQPYWFLVVSESIPTLEFGEELVDLWQPEVDFRYTSFPVAVEGVLKTLALFDWKANLLMGGEEDGDPKERLWRGFGIPFVLELDDNLLKPPRPAPDLSTLALEPYYPDPETGQQHGWVPVELIDLNEDETRRFIRFTRRIVGLHRGLRIHENKWLFLDVALGYLTKAFFVEGLDQLLCHVTAVEALVGEKGHGVTERLAERVASILGNGDSERQAKKGRFEELYGLRCDLVHGRQLRTQAYVGDLRDARDIARRVTVWFLHYLAQLQALNPQDPPDRRECLALLDTKPQLASHLVDLRGQVPTFPRVPEWLA
jgi:hypothetical protein